MAERLLSVGLDVGTTSTQLILSELSEEGRGLFLEYQDLQEHLSAISEEDSFVNGFRIGVGLILDAVGTYESQFVRYHED